METRGKIIYLSGERTDSPNCKVNFAIAEQFMLNMGCIVINPTKLEVVCPDFTPEETNRVCYKMIEMSDVIFMVSGWQKSSSANAELCYARSIGKKVMYQEYYHQFRRKHDEEST